MTRTWPPQPRYARGNHSHDFAMHLSDEYPEAFGYLLQRDDANEDMWVKSAALILERGADGKPSRCATVLGEESCEDVVGKRFLPMKETFSIVEGCDKRNGSEDSRSDVMLVGLSLPWARKAIANAPGNRIAATVWARQGERRVGFYGALKGPGRSIADIAVLVLRTVARTIARRRYDAFAQEAVRDAHRFEIDVRVAPGKRRTSSPETIATVQAGMRAAFRIAQRGIITKGMMNLQGDEDPCAILHMEASVTPEKRRFTITPSFAETDPWQKVKDYGRRYFVDVPIANGLLLALAIGSAWELEHGIIDPVEDLEIRYPHSATLRAAATAALQDEIDGEMPAIAAMLEAVGCASQAPAILAEIQRTRGKAA